MKEQIIAKAYAKALTSLGEEGNTDVASDLTKITEAINSSNDLENIFFLDVFTIEEKLSVITEVMNKLELSNIIKSFITFLLNEKRVGILPLIYKETIVLDDHKKGFLRGTIESSLNEIDESVKKELTDLLDGKTGKKTDLKYIKNNSITAGYRVTVDDLQLDATVDNQFNNFKQEILDS